MATKKYALKSIGIISLANFYAIFMGLIYFFVGFIYAALNLANLGLLWIIILPLAGLLFGFLMGVITAFVFNLIAGWLGGIEFEVEKRK
ncbi:MAG: hypothetical protein HY438_01310 [DPANN group archaeon]|nr:hypothetical protein [DPANN group archaeon]